MIQHNTILSSFYLVPAVSEEVRLVGSKSLSNAINLDKVTDFYQNLKLCLTNAYNMKSYAEFQKIHKPQQLIYEPAEF